MDSDGDVDMERSIQPVCEYVKAPRLTSWSQSFLVRWTRERMQYEKKVSERCMTTGEDADKLQSSVKTCMDPEILSHVSRFILKRSENEVTDADLKRVINDKCGSLQNGHIPDIPGLFYRELKMNMQEEDTDARVLEYFVLFDKIVREQGLTSIMGQGRLGEVDFKDRMKNRCKILIENLQPAILKSEITRLVQFEKRAAKVDDVLLYDLVVEKAKAQQHYHTMLRENKAGVRDKKTGGELRK